MRRERMIGLSALAVLGPTVFGLVHAPRIYATLPQYSGDTPAFRFEVATVKLSSGQGENSGIFMSPGSFKAESRPLKNVIMFAYDIRSGSQISGYPNWVDSTEYDINAKIDETTSASLGKLPQDQRIRQMKLMVQALLAERFHLRVSYQAKEVPVYALVIAKGGSKLTKSTGPLILAGGGTRSGIIETKNGEVEGIDSSLDEFAAAVPDLMPEVSDRIVVNKTGLAGNYNWNLIWTPETATQDPGGASPPLASNDSAPSLFTALREQLGLKLESQRALIETLVIDSVDRPTAN